MRAPRGMREAEQAVAHTLWCPEGCHPPRGSTWGPTPMRGGGAYTSGTRVGCIMGCGPADEGSMEAMADAAERARSVGEARGCARGACVVVAVGRERPRGRRRVGAPSREAVLAECGWREARGYGPVASLGRVRRRWRRTGVVRSAIAPPRPHVRGDGRRVAVQRGGGRRAVISASSLVARRPLRRPVDGGRAAAAAAAAASGVWWSLFNAGGDV